MEAIRLFYGFVEFITTSHHDYQQIIIIIFIFYFFRRFGPLQYDGSGRGDGPELGGSVRLFGGRSQWYQPAWRGVRQRSPVAGLDATENRRAGALGSQAVRHIPHTAGLQRMRVQNSRQVCRYRIFWP